MATSFPDQTRVVVIGGGIIGCSTAYHLAKAGCDEVVLLERKKLTSGSTWHAAGVVGQLRSSANITRLLGHSVALYAALEEETGQATGWRASGSLRLACSKDRRIEYQRAITTARSFGLEMELLTPAEAKGLFPVMNVDDLDCAIYLPSDGVASPSDLTMALAKGARMNGASIFEETKVTGFNIREGRLEGVKTDKGEISCEAAVIATGIWSRALGKLAGVNIPIQPSHHHYIVTDRIEGLTPNTPAMRDPDKLTYFKEEIGGLITGGYEFNPIPYRESPIPEDHEFKLFPEEIEHFEQLMLPAIERIPALESVGVKQWFNGLEAFTEDTMFILGEAPEVRGLFVGCGFNSMGIASGGGAGMALASWILEGEPPYDLWAVDIRRFSDFHRSDERVAVRALEGQAHHYVMGWPHYEMQAGRPFRRSPVYERLAANRACFGNKTGWERPNWFAPRGVEPKDEYSFGRANWFAHVGEEHRAAREAVALFDMSYFSKFAFLGRDAEAVLQRICSGNVGKEPGRVTYTQMLNERGGIECDLTVARLSENAYYIVTGTAFATHDSSHIRRHTPEDADAALIDVTSAHGTLALMGPKARDVLSRVAEGDIGNDGFPFGHVREIFVAGAPVRAIRITFVGELGWELHIPSEYMVTVYDALKGAGAEFGIKDAGYRAIDSLRLEKGYRVWAADIGPDYTPLEAGLGFTVSFKKNVDFIGRDALVRQREAPLTKRLAIFTVDDPEMILLGRETIYREGKRVGWLTSAGHGYTVGKDIGLGYVRDDGGVTDDDLASGNYELEVADRRVPATLHLAPLYDPENKKVRG
ncbi:MAG: FAD-dependent oxidoreductase [Proteobacteria bacterium]|nr:FAD-dependent oxidoreductase [Pseudomonadota bacterium]